MFEFFIVSLLFMNSPQILLDPGHGGFNKGALAVDGKTYEKKLTLNLSLKIAHALSKKGITCKLTRRKDTFLSLKDRSELAFKINPNCFVSIHFNASIHHNRSGIEIYYPDHDYAVPAKILIHGIQLVSTFLKTNQFSNIITSLYLSQLKKTSMIEGALNFAKRLAWRLEARKYFISRVAPAKFDIMSESGVKTILFEAGFIDNTKDWNKISDERYINKLAIDIADILSKLCYY